MLCGADCESTRVVGIVFRYCRTRRSVCPSVCLFVCLSVYLSVRPVISPPTQVSWGNAFVCVVYLTDTRVELSTQLLRDDASLDAAAHLSAGGQRACRRRAHQLQRPPPRQPRRPQRACARHEPSPLTSRRHAPRPAQLIASCARKSAAAPAGKLAAPSLSRRTSN